MFVNMCRPMCLCIYMHVYVHMYAFVCSSCGLGMCMYLVRMCAFLLHASVSVAFVNICMLVSICLYVCDGVCAYHVYFVCVCICTCMYM